VRVQRGRMLVIWGGFVKWLIEKVFWGGVGGLGCGGCAVAYPPYGYHATCCAARRGIGPTIRSPRRIRRCRREGCTGAHPCAPPPIGGAFGGTECSRHSVEPEGSNQELSHRHT